MYKLFYEDEAPSFSAICTLFNYPFKADLEDKDIAIEGFPFESASVNRAEARYAPSAIRNHISFKGSLGYSEILDVDAADYIKGTDLGEAVTYFGYKEPTLKSIYEDTLKVVNSDTILIGLGGGQLVTLAELRAYKEKYGEVALVHLSAKRSCRDYHEKYDDSTVIIRAMEEKLIDPKSSIQVGIRGGYDSKAECEFGKDLGIKVLPASKMYEMSVQEVIEEIKKQVGDKPIFISLDLNFLDPIYAPGVVDPVVGGFSTYYVKRILRELARDTKVKGFDLVGMTPVYDAGNVAAQASSSIIRSLIMGLAKKKQLGNEL